jgi:hypothetical protein
MSKYLVYNFIVLLYFIEIGMNSKPGNLCDEKKLESIFKE